jgi:uncharacterized protein (TIGR00251 family)
MGSWIVADGHDVLISVHAVPGAKRSEIVGIHGDRLRVKVAAPAEGGRANRALEKFLAGVFEAPVSVVRGHGSRWKTVRVEAAGLGDIRSRLPVD